MGSINCAACGKKTEKTGKYITSDNKEICPHCARTAMETEEFEEFEGNPYTKPKLFIKTLSSAEVAELLSDDELKVQCEVKLGPARVWMTPSHITYQKSLGVPIERKSLVDVVARVESGRELRSRVTVPRLALIGVYAFAAQERSGGEKYLTIEGKDFFWTLEASYEEARKAADFAQKVNTRSKAFTKEHSAAIMAAKAEDQTSDVSIFLKYYPNRESEIKQLDAEGKLTQQIIIAQNERIIECLEQLISRGEE